MHSGAKSTGAASHSLRTCPRTRAAVLASETVALRITSTRSSRRCLGWRRSTLRITLSGTVFSRSRAEFTLPKRQANLRGVHVSQLLHLRNDRAQRPHRIAPYLHRRGARMAGRALQHNVVPAHALHPGHDPNLQTFALQHRSPFDVHFERGFYRMGFGTRRLAEVADPRQFRADREPRLVGSAVIAGELKDTRPDPGANRRPVENARLPHWSRPRPRADARSRYRRR